jgi:hypothetical protein
VGVLPSLPPEPPWRTVEERYFTQPLLALLRSDETTNDVLSSRKLQRYFDGRQFFAFLSMIA